MDLKEFLAAFRKKLRETTDRSFTLFPYTRASGVTCREIRVATPDARFQHTGNADCQCPIQFVAGEISLAYAIRKLNLNEELCDKIVASADDNRENIAFDAKLRHRLLDARRPADHGRAARRARAAGLDVVA